MKHSEALEAIKEHDKLLAENGGGLSRFHATVLMQYHDGTQLHLDGAYKVKLKEWLLIATEHHGYFAYLLEDVDWWAQFRKSYH